MTDHAGTDHSGKGMAGSDPPLPDACIEREEIYDGRVVRLGVDTVRFPNGEVGQLELVRHPGASAVLPFLDPPTDPDPRILLIRQYRYAAGGSIYEVP